MRRKIRLFVSRHIGFFLPPVGEWEPDPYFYLMRRLTPSGEWEYREMTERERVEEQQARAW